MTRRTLLFGLILFCVSWVCYSDELTVTELIRGVNQGRQTIQSGELVVQVTVIYPPEKSEVEIDAWIQAETKKAMEDIRLGIFHKDLSIPYTDPSDFEKVYLIPTLNFQATLFRQRTVVEKSHVAFQLQGIDTGPPLYKITIVENPRCSLESFEAENHQAGNFHLLAYDTQSQIREHIGDIVSPAPSAGSISLSRSNYFAGYRPFESYGHSSGSVPISAKRIGKEVVDGAACEILTYEVATGQNVTIWVDPSIDFCLRRTEVKESRDTPVIVYLSEYKQFQQFGDVWYPKVTQITECEVDGSRCKMTSVEVVVAEFNINFPKDFFKIDRDFYEGHGRRVRDMETPRFGRDGSLPSTDSEELLLLCGPQSLLRICEILNITTNLNELKKLTQFTPTRGTTMLGLKDAATYKGLAPIGVKATLKLLKKEKVPLPAIAYVDENHFLVFEAVTQSGIKISDSAHKYNPHLSWDELADIWDGELLIFDTKKGPKRKPQQIPIAFTETPEYDFGKALGGSEIKHTFTIKNIGQKPLKILSVTETCACTASVLSQDEISPGGEGSISAVLTVPSANKQVQENLLVLTDDPTESTLTLTLKGQAFIPLTTFPEHLAFGSQKPLQKPLTKKISLHVQKDVQILDVRTDTEHVKAKKETEGNIPHVEVMLLPSLPIGQFSHNLLIDYEYRGQQSTHKLPIFGEVLGDFWMTPKRLFFGMIKETETFSKKIAISPTRDHFFKITAVESSSKAVIAKVTKMDADMPYQVTVTIVPNAESGEISGEIFVRTSSPTQPILRVPFFGIVAGSR